MCQVDYGVLKCNATSSPLTQQPTEINCVFSYMQIQSMRLVPLLVIYKVIQQFIFKR